MPLMIVESPAKTKTIEKYLGKGWDVAASVGHIRDLCDKTGLGFDQETLLPVFKTDKGKLKVVSRLKTLTSKHNGDVYLATDLDREGEAIAWHLKEVLKLSSPKRVVFSEITRKAISKAINNPRSIDMEFVAAANARRVIDRMIGYIVSPELIRRSGIKGLSAGRVQSPAVKIVDYREKEIQNHVKREFYTSVLLLDNGITAELCTKPFGKHIFDKAILEQLTNIKEVMLKSAEIKEKQIIPPEPLTTSSLVQAAGKHFKFSTKTTMDLAQRLFDAGMITYHRTDSIIYSEDGYLAAKEHMENLGFKTVEQRKWSTKAGSQEAHEGIRPTNFTTNQAIEDKDAQQLYEYILERSLATTLPSAIDQHTSYSFLSTSIAHQKLNDVEVIYQAKGIVESRAGWRDFVKTRVTTRKDKTLPLSKIDDHFKVENNTIKRSFTKPPKRYTEPSLVAAMEKLLIGRPSTYGAIMENIKSREYISVSNRDNFLYAKEKGSFIVKSLDSMRFMNLDYTKRIEEALDKIAKGQAKYFPVVNHIHETLNTEITGLDVDSQVELLDCPYKCGNQIKRLKSKKGRYFWIHAENNDDCKEYIDDTNGKPEKSVESDCPNECGIPIKRLKSKKNTGNYFWVHTLSNHGCNDYISDKNGTPNIRDSDR